MTKTNQRQTPTYNTQRNPINYRPLGSLAPYLSIQLNSQRAPIKIDDNLLKQQGEKD